ncbi:hypothetical protein SNEBB_004959 [Seison nebaliae]|nr:hypothetical protein SNEBB_004959 [Seison nebaliae]
MKISINRYINQSFETKRLTRLSKEEFNRIHLNYRNKTHKLNYFFDAVKRLYCRTQVYYREDIFDDFSDIQRSSEFVFLTLEDVVKAFRYRHLLMISNSCLFGIMNKKEYKDFVEYLETIELSLILKTLFKRFIHDLHLLLTDDSGIERIENISPGKFFQILLTCLQSLMYLASTSCWNYKQILLDHHFTHCVIKSLVECRESIMELGKKWEKVWKNYVDNKPDDLSLFGEVIRIRYDNSYSNSDCEEMSRQLFDTCSFYIYLSFTNIIWRRITFDLRITESYFHDVHTKTLEQQLLLFNCFKHLHLNYGTTKEESNFLIFLWKKFTSIQLISDILLKSFNINTTREMMECSLVDCSELKSSEANSLLSTNYLSKKLSKFLDDSFLDVKKDEKNIVVKKHHKLNVKLKVNRNILRLINSFNDQITSFESLIFYIRYHPAPNVILIDLLEEGKLFCHIRQLLKHFDLRRIKYHSNDERSPFLRLFILTVELLTILMEKFWKNMKSRSKINTKIVKLIQKHENNLIDYVHFIWKSIIHWETADKHFQTTVIQFFRIGIQTKIIRIDFSLIVMFFTRILVSFFKHYGLLLPTLKQYIRQHNERINLKTFQRTTLFNSFTCLGILINADSNTYNHLTNCCNYYYRSLQERKSTMINTSTEMNNSVYTLLQNGSHNAVPILYERYSSNSYDENDRSIPANLSYHSIENRFRKTFDHSLRQEKFPDNLDKIWNNFSLITPIVFQNIVIDQYSSLVHQGRIIANSSNNLPTIVKEKQFMEIFLEFLLNYLTYSHVLLRNIFLQLLTVEYLPNQILTHCKKEEFMIRTISSTIFGRPILEETSEFSQSLVIYLLFEYDRSNLKILLVRCIVHFWARKKIMFPKNDIDLKSSCQKLLKDIENNISNSDKDNIKELLRYIDITKNSLIGLREVLLKMENDNYSEISFLFSDNSKITKEQQQSIRKMISELTGNKTMKNQGIISNLVEHLDKNRNFCIAPNYNLGKSKNLNNDNCTEMEVDDDSENEPFITDDEI